MAIAQTSSKRALNINDPGTTLTATPRKEGYSDGNNRKKSIGRCMAFIAPFGTKSHTNEKSYRSVEGFSRRSLNWGYFLANSLDMNTEDSSKRPHEIIETATKS